MKKNCTCVIALLLTLILGINTAQAARYVQTGYYYPPQPAVYHTSTQYYEPAPVRYHQPRHQAPVVVERREHVVVERRDSGVGTFLGLAALGLGIVALCTR